GACVGPRGSRVRMVVSELRGEKIDIIPYNDEPARFVAKALSPARVREVLVDDDAKQATVIVPDDQLSLAIGKEGQNARLAARLTGWRVDIRSETEFAKEEAEMTYDEEEMSGRCAAILSNGKRCPNSAEPGSRYCGLPAHQELAHQEGDQVGGGVPAAAAVPDGEPPFDVALEPGVEEVIEAEASAPDSSADGEPIEEGPDEIAAEAVATEEPDVDPTDDDEEVNAIGDENDDVLAADEPPTPSGAADSLNPHDGESVTSQTEAPGTDPHPEDREIAEELGVEETAEERA
ncbi:MAG: transcription termination/antitermination protein NusA, partial [Thermoleophilales bacterium]|nr:transcription termination/antitermination protein NusA [Thermoleophilales bacterium]